MDRFNGLIRLGTLAKEADGRRNEFDIKNSVIVLNKIIPDICFIGDSLTNGWELYAYFNKFGTLVNRGIGGDVVQIINKRFEADVLQLKPKLCVLMAGVNNMGILDDAFLKDSQTFNNCKNDVYKLLFDNFKDILNKAKNHNQAIMLCSIMPLKKQWNYKNEFILSVNQMLRNLSDEYNLQFIDFHKEMVGNDGLALRNELSWDNCHPHVYGYNIMAQTLMPYLDNFFQNRSK